MDDRAGLTVARASLARELVSVRLVPCAASRPAQADLGLPFVRGIQRSRCKRSILKRSIADSAGEAAASEHPAGGDQAAVCGEECSGFRLKAGTRPAKVNQEGRASGVACDI